MMRHSLREIGMRFGIISAVVILDTTNNLLVMVEGFWIITLNHDTNIAVFSEITKRIT